MHVCLKMQGQVFREVSTESSFWCMAGAFKLQEPWPAGQVADPWSISSGGLVSLSFVRGTSVM